MKKFRICVIVIERNLIIMCGKGVFMQKKFISAIIAVLSMFNLSALAISTYEFDEGMSNSIRYFYQGLYYEAKDEFTWFKNYNYNRINYGQQKHLDDYLNGTQQKIEQLENPQSEAIKLYSGAPAQYGCYYHIKVEDAIILIKQRYGIDVIYTETGNQFFWFEGGGHKFSVDRWYPTDDVNDIKTTRIY